MKRIISAVIGISIITANVIGPSANSLNVTAEDLTINQELTGDCGENIKWTFDESSGVLTISGNGQMYDGENISYTAWTYSKYASTIKEVIIEEGVTSVGSCAFGERNVVPNDSNDRKFPNLVKISLPSTLTKIKGYAFKNCPLKGELKLPSSLNSLGQEAFAYTDITSINSLNDDMTIGGTAFKKCKGLTEVTIPKGLEYLKNFEGNMKRANSMFNNCVNIEKVIMEDGAIFAEEMFKGCEKVTEVVIKSNTFDKIITGANTPFPSYIDDEYSNFIDQITFKTYKGSETEKNLLAIGVLPEKIVYFVDLTSLEKAIKKAEAIETDKYTDASANALVKVIADAKAVLKNENTTQEEVDAAEKSVNDAVKALVVKTKDSSNNSNNPSNQTSGNNKKLTKVTRNAKVVAKDKKAAQKVMKQAKLNSLKVKSGAKKKISASWKKVKKAKGYEVQVSAKKNFKKVIFKKDLNKTKLTIKNKNIKSKKTYYVRVRAYAAYKDANNKTVKVYSKWNKQLRKVKVK